MGRPLPRDESRGDGGIRVPGLRKRLLAKYREKCDQGGEVMRPYYGHKVRKLESGEPFIGYLWELLPDDAARECRALFRTPTGGTLDGNARFVLEGEGRLRMASDSDICGPEEAKRRARLRDEATQ